MEDTIIQYETAKLAKEKGCKNSLGLTPLAFDCTQASLQKWLRENHQLHITIFSSSQESWMFRITKPHQTLKDGIYAEDFASYEEALEAGLLEALTLI